MKILYFVIAVLLVSSCQNNHADEAIDENQLGFIDASVKSQETNLKEKAKFSEETPGSGVAIERAFENAPPMIPHTTDGFFPIKIDNNICLSCHMPDKVEETGAVSIPKMHFTNLRPQMQLINGKYVMTQQDTLVRQYLNKLDNAYYNCNQCHVPQADVSVDIKNLFTPEFREEFGLEQSTLEKQFNDGL